MEMVYETAAGNHKICVFGRNTRRDWSFRDRGMINKYDYVK